LFNSTNNQGTVYVCGPDGLNVLQRTTTGWKFACSYHQVKGIETRTAIDDENGNVWVGTYANGIIRITLSGGDTLVRHYGLEDGLPTLRMTTYLL
jgi:ligand-binding sensor domain-containing protein